MTVSLIDDPLLPHLLEIFVDPAADGLILAGGFGLRLKQEYLRQSAAQTLIADFPPARATQDLDLFLRIEIWTDSVKGTAVRALLDRMGYQERVAHLKFEKPFDPKNPEDRKIKVDLLARTPPDEKWVPVRRAPDPARHPSRVGAGTGIDLHGGETPEAFAVEERTLSLPVRGVTTTEGQIETAVSVPHPYAWLNMKVKAADDWTLRPKPFAEKHAFDVYLLASMLTSEEVEVAARLARSYQDHPVAVEIRAAATRLYGDRSGPGFQEAERQARQELDHEIFWEALQDVLGIPR